MTITIEEAVNDAIDAAIRPDALYASRPHALLKSLNRHRIYVRRWQRTPDRNHVATTAKELHALADWHTARADYMATLIAKTTETKQLTRRVIIHKFHVVTANTLLALASAADPST